MLAQRLLEGPLGMPRTPIRAETGRVVGSANLSADVKVLNDDAMVYAHSLYSHTATSK